MRRDDKALERVASRTRIPCGTVPAWTSEAPLSTGCGWRYGTSRPAEPGEADRFLKILVIPFLAWANRGIGSMRVWLPASPRLASGGR